MITGVLFLYKNSFHEKYRCSANYRQGHRYLKSSAWWRVFDPTMP
jgi:hypothetical protein